MRSPRTYSYAPSLSADGRYLPLSVADANAYEDVYVRVLTH
ncbi:MAG: hypothetical protein U0Q03_07380 [Acidimicrobiales bacterium]